MLATSLLPLLLVGLVSGRVFHRDNSSSTTTSFNSTTTTSTCPTSTTKNPYAVIPSGYTSPQIDYPLEPSYAHRSSKWKAAHRKARDYLSDWSIEEKVQLTTGVGWALGRCVGNIPSVPEHNFSGLCLQDSPLGVRLTDHVSAFPAGINVAATFDKDLMYHRGLAMGQEFRGKGVHVALGPMTNMGRVAAGGRNWEGFGGDPYLSGWATEMTIRGLQDAGVQATVKHFVGNEQERNRTTSSSNIDDRTLREIYTHPFLRAVAADVAAVMCSYNLINGSWACQDSKTLNGVLKTDFGFEGYVMSDWTATHSGVLSVNSGLDMTMPGDVTFDSYTSFFGSNLTEAVNNGSVAEARLDDMAERIMAAYFLVGQDQDYPDVNFDAFKRYAPETNSFVNVQDDHWKLIQRIGAASIVLLKNDQNVLPLNKPKSLVLFGSDLGPPQLGPNGFGDRGGDDGTFAMGWGSGTCEFPYLVDPVSAIVRQAREDGTDVAWTFNDWDLYAASSSAANADIAIVGIKSQSGEDYITVDGNEGDRNNLTAWNNGDNLILAVASYCKNTIVVVHSVGPIIMEPWIDHPNVTAVLWAGLPGQESGNSLVDILYGKYNPSGRLPYTIAKNRSDYSADIFYVSSDSIPEPQVNYEEGLNIDYRHFLANNITPRYEFGYGLSYTTFELSNLQIYESDTTFEYFNFTTELYDRILTDSLQKPRWTISVDVENTGSVDGCEVAQLYLTYPPEAGEPPRVLRDFARINLQPQTSDTVTFTLSKYDVSIWDVVKQDWVVPSGEFGVTVSRSSMDSGVTTSFCPFGC
ncbi:hypothetical protein TREMEDRAFT_41754 [Tremella mesenterica DSM 1558]|uniref:uncharacterized protein n=1 Tax=Tremella mesenterica (strain ATCC 24925 / CBS 8224 / DSM 1558 / NBRC 9311 / NRRL Y-6157 / RJB 2259-6 / UBC 559-6) TaxID=578456 RepID=UPI0003F4996A|nr:uncharacterized protein TREMEDRAFT_41754 [Tremella mesenterica DSM 1558]EIW72437.1 hypothetical protein TREMEDRAFT_41754 [Tremella mesenterica DSM 1558]